MSFFKFSFAVSMVALALLASCGKDTGPLAPTQSRGAITDTIAACLAEQAACLKAIPSPVPGPQLPAFFKCKRPIAPCQTGVKLENPPNPVPPNFREPLR